MIRSQPSKVVVVVVVVVVCVFIVWCHRRGKLTDKKDISRQRNQQVQKVWSGKGFGVLDLRLPKSPVWVPG